MTGERRSGRGRIARLGAGSVLAALLSLGPSAAPVEARQDAGPADTHARTTRSGSTRPRVVRAAAPSDVAHPATRDTDGVPPSGSETSGTSNDSCGLPVSIRSGGYPAGVLTAYGPNRVLAVSNGASGPSATPGHSGKSEVIALAVGAGGGAIVGGKLGGKKGALIGALVGAAGAGLLRHAPRRQARTRFPF